MKLVYASIALHDRTYKLIIQKEGQPTPDQYKISKPQLASLLSGCAWVLYEDLLKCDQPTPTAPSDATNAKR